MRRDRSEVGGINPALVGVSQKLLRPEKVCNGFDKAMEAAGRRNCSRYLFRAPPQLFLQRILQARPGPISSRLARGFWFFSGCVVSWKLFTPCRHCDSCVDFTDQVRSVPRWSLKIFIRLPPVVSFPDVESGEGTAEAVFMHADESAAWYLPRAGLITDKQDFPPPSGSDFLLLP